MCCDATDSWKTTDGPAALSIIRKRVWHDNTFLYKVFYSQGRPIKKLKSVLNILYIVDLIIIVVEVCLFSGHYKYLNYHLSSVCVHKWNSSHCKNLKTRCWLFVHTRSLFVSYTIDLKITVNVSHIAVISFVLSHIFVALLLVFRWYTLLRGYFYKCYFLV